MDDDDFPEDSFGVPGLGFDEAHLAATRGPRAVGVRRHNRFSSGFFPFGGGFLFPFTSVVEQAPPTEAQPAEVIDTVAPDSARRVRPRDTASVHLAAPENEAESENEEYIFVRRDGTLIFAVAYSWDNQMLRYITQEGLRRSVTREALDLAATQQFNEQRGLNFRSPA